MARFDFDWFTELLLVSFLNTQILISMHTKSSEIYSRVSGHKNDFLLPNRNSVFYLCKAKFQDIKRCILSSRDAFLGLQLEITRNH